MARFPSTSNRKRNAGRLTAATIGIFCVIAGSQFEGAGAFGVHTPISKAQQQQQQQPQQISRAKPAVPDSSTTTVIRHRSSSRTNTHLKALPAALASTPSAVGTIVATIANILVPSTASVASKTIRTMALLLGGLLVVSQKARQRLFWPGLAHPENPEHDLLPGSLGCPFLGSPWLYFAANESYGAGNYYRKASKALGKALGNVPKIWKYYVMGAPFAVVSGGKTFQKVLGMEFDGSLTSSGIDLMEGGLLPTESLLFERSKKRHSYLRRLVGAALTPQAVGKTAPALQSAVQKQVDKIVEAASSDDDQPVEFHQVCTDYTLDVAWRQILGLELADEEIPIFEQNVATWIEGITSLKVVFKIGVESHPGYAAREYVISKIEERIDQLLTEGPDNKSTLSGMIFATDEEDPTKRLSKKEIIDNALILIFAGSETSASTLTNAMLFLGLHPTVWNQLAEEQTKIQQEHGESLTMTVLDANNAPYLDAVLKETMRMRTVVSGIPRVTLKDIDVDGDGKTIIPKGYLVDPSMLLTHEEDPNTKLPGAMHLDAIQGFRPERWLESSGSSDAKKPDNDWYVPYGFGPRYCLGKNLAQLEMKIFLALVARKLDFPKLSMLPEGYDYSPNKKDPSSEDYFSVAWSTGGAVIPTASDGVLASVSGVLSEGTATATPAQHPQAEEQSNISFPVHSITLPGVTNSTRTEKASPL